MELNEFILHLIRLEAKHGKNIRVLVNHDDADIPEFVDVLDGCPPYISIT